MKSGGASKRGAAHFAGVDDGGQPLDQVGAHFGPISHCNVIESKSAVFLL
jgi:hypothetical protein